MEENKTPILTLDAEDAVEPGRQTPDSVTEAEVLLSEIAAPDTPAPKLTLEEQRQVTEFARKIDITNSARILQYGAQAQKKIAAFSESTLNNVRAKDMGEVGDMISSLVGELRTINQGEGKKGFRLFKKAGDSLAQMKTGYASLEKNVDRITDELERHKITLLKDIATLDKMYDMNLDYYKELTMYIMAGKEKLAQVQGGELPALQEKAAASGLQEDAQAAKNMAEMCNRFEKKLYDLELTRTISMQMAPQIRMVQNTDSTMVDKIQSSIVNTIPLWKNQMVLALGLAHSKKAIEAQRAVTDTTNELLKKNAEILRTNTIDAAKESERGIVDIETLRETNATLISTLDEVLTIQQDGRTRRQEAEKELRAIEEELKHKLLEISVTTGGRS